MLQSLIHFLTTPNEIVQFCTVQFWLMFVLFLIVYAFIYWREAKSLQKRLREGQTTDITPFWAKTQNWRLAYVIAFSLFFFWKANGWVMVLLPVTALATWTVTRWMETIESRNAKKWLLALNVILNLLPLLYFKYANFLLVNFAQLVQTNFNPLDIALPIGISFYTFQGISYAVDIYRGKFTERVSFLSYLFYLSFFPLLLAGPITRAGTLFPQLKRTTRISETMACYGIFLIILGLIKKGVVADYLATYNNLVFDMPATYSGFENMMAVLGYTLQIYFDFSGYSDLSIGIAAVLGIRLRDNFNMPYQSLNLTEFWRRWHISLSTWFRDYFYIPLGGNRKGNARTYLNCFLTMLLAGVWHGASWMFVIWGALHGLGLVVHKFCKKHGLDKLPKNVWTKVTAWTITMLYVMVAWVFFRAANLQDASAVFTKIFTDFDWAYLPPFVEKRTLCFILIVLSFLLFAVRRKTMDRLAARFILMPWPVKSILFLIIVQIMLQLQQGSVAPLLYAEF